MMIDDLYISVKCSKIRNRIFKKNHITPIRHHLTYSKQSVIHITQHIFSTIKTTYKNIIFQNRITHFLKAESQEQK